MRGFLRLRRRLRVPDDLHGLGGGLGGLLQDLVDPGLVFRRLGRGLRVLGGRQRAGGRLRDLDEFGLVLRRGLRIQGEGRAVGEILRELGAFDCLGPGVSGCFGSGTGVGGVGDAGVPMERVFGACGPASRAAAAAVGNATAAARQETPTMRESCRRAVSDIVNPGALEDGCRPVPTRLLTRPRVTRMRAQQCALGDTIHSSPPVRLVQLRLRAHRNPGSASENRPASGAWGGLDRLCRTPGMRAARHRQDAHHGERAETQFPHFFRTAGTPETPPTRAMSHNHRLPATESPSRGEQTDIRPLPGLPRPRRRTDPP